MVKAEARSGARRAAVVGEGLTHSSILCDLAFRTPRVLHPTLHHAYPEQPASSWECGAGEAACGGGGAGPGTPSQGIREHYGHTGGALCGTPVTAQVPRVGCVCVGGREASVSEAMGAAVGTRPCRRAQ